jgi:hypothetical protein
MTREQIIASAKKGAELAASKGFAATPRKQKHIHRLLELKKRRQMDEKHNEEEMAVELRRVAG